MIPKKFVPWAEWEDEILRKFSSLPRRELYPLLPHRSKNAVNGRRVVLGICSERFPWAEWEDEILRGFAGKFRKDAARALPHRSMDSIHGRIKKLGIAQRDRKAQHKKLRGLWFNPSLSTVEIAEQMGIKPRGVAVMACKIKLGGRPLAARKPYTKRVVERMAAE